jgi:hypothetical protein
MKILLILSLIFWATVSGKTKFDFEEDYSPDKTDAVAPNQVTAYSDLNNYISEVDFKFYNSLYISHILFETVKSPFLLHTFIRSAEINIDYKSTSFNLLKQNNKTLSLFSGFNNTSDNSISKVCWNRLTLDSYIHDHIAHSNQIIYNDFGKEAFNESEFKYAGSKRFTLSGDLPNLYTEIKPLQASAVTAVAIVTGIALHINQSAAWWDGKGRSFYFYDDWDDVLFADKFGHFMGGYFISYLSREAFVFSGFSWDKSIFLGSLVGLLAQTYVEFKDGYAENTGFSTSDFAADVAGVAYFYLQHYVPVLQNFSPKWQYAPPSMIGVSPKARTQTFLDNYNSTTAWISVQVRNLFWGEKDSFWPKWLNVGFGYGVNGYYTPDIYSRFVIGIDYNLVELLPDGVPFWNWLKQSLNCIKFPAPAIEFSNQGTSFKLFYPFTISIGSVQL